MTAILAVLIVLGLYAISVFLTGCIIFFTVNLACLAFGLVGITFFQAIAMGLVWNLIAFFLNTLLN